MRAILTAAAIALLGLQPVRAEPTPELHERPRSHPPFVVHAGGAVPQEIAAPDGKIRLVNVWATWCPPCRKEMASLDRLQAVLGAEDFEVVAVSVDDGDAHDKVSAFFDRVGVKHLTPYVADRGRLAGAFAVWGLPTSILFDGNGREIARLVGQAAWDSVDMVAFFLTLLEREKNAPPEENAVMPSAALSPALPRLMPPRAQTDSRPAPERQPASATDAGPTPAREFSAAGSSSPPGRQGAPSRELAPRNR